MCCTASPIRYHSAELRQQSHTIGLRCVYDPTTLRRTIILGSPWLNEETLLRRDSTSKRLSDWTLTTLKPSITLLGCGKFCNRHHKGECSICSIFFTHTIFSISGFVAYRQLNLDHIQPGRAFWGITHPPLGPNLRQMFDRMPTDYGC